MIKYAFLKKKKKKRYLEIFYIKNKYFLQTRKFYKEKVYFYKQIHLVNNYFLKI